MHEYDDILLSLPTAYRKDRWVRDLLEAIRGLDESQRAEMLDTAAQLCPASMTWLLETEERIAGIVPGRDATLEDRRSALMARWRGAGKCTVSMIQSVCDSWRNGEIAVSFTGGEIRLTFNGALGVPEAGALAALKEQIEAVVPAHLLVAYLYRYLLVREVAAMTLDGLQGHTINEFAF